MRRRVFGIVLLLALLALFILPLSAVEKGYQVRYLTPTFESDASVDTYPPMLYELLKDININVASGEDFNYSNELSKSAEEGEQFEWSGDRKGKITIKGSIVELTGYATPKTALYGTLSFRIETTYTTDGVHTYVDYETAAIKETKVFTYDGPFYILTSADSEGNSLDLGLDPINGSSADMIMETYHYNAAGEQVYYDKSNEFPPSGYTFYVDDAAPKTPVTIDTDAADTAGETSSAVPAAIVLGVAAAAAAIAGAGASGGSKNQEESKKASTYKMYIYKDFGNSIRYDKPAVIVYARMAEVNPEGVETQRPDLTSQISIFSSDSYMRIGAPTLAGDYIGATVEAESVKGQQNPPDGVVSFQFTGEGGSFQNNVTFQLVGDPYIKFEKPQGDSIAVLLGDDGHYESAFSLVDFIEAAKVRIKPMSDSFPFELEPIQVQNLKYKLSLQNHSIKPEKPKATQEIFKFELFAENEKESARSIITVTLYPEGLTVRGVNFDDKGYAKIGAYADQEKSEGGEEVLATRFIVDLAVGKKDEKGNNIVELVDVSTVNPEIGKLKGSDTATENLAKVFTYEIKDAGHGAYQFQPQMQIPEMRNPYYLALPIACDYENAHYTLDFPVRLLGEPFNEMKDKQEELRLLLARVRRYMPPEEWSSVVRFFQERFDSMSVREIRLMNRSLCEITQNKLTRESQELKDFADDLDWVIGSLEWVKWTGDQALSILLTMYTGPIGEAVIMPAKEIIVSFLAEYASEIWLCNATLQSQDQMTRGIRSNLSAMLENSLMSQIDTKNLNMKKLGTILAAFAVLKLINHYFNDVGPDGKPVGFLDAILSTFSDLTINVFKLAFQQKFEQFVDNKSVKELFDKYCKGWMKKLLDSRVGDWQEKGIDIIQKYLIEFVGEGVAWAYNKTSSKAGQTTFKQDAGDIVITLNLYDYPPEQHKDPLLVDINLSKVKDKVIDYIFDCMFEMFPFPTSPVNPPNDPPFTPSMQA